MESKEPIVSVLMTVYNRRQFIGDAIESVLNSSLSDFELIIVDDNSTDDSIEIARHFEKKDARINVYQNDTNLGQFKNRNRAASYANGRYIKYLDSDDLIYPHGLEVMVKAMLSFPEACIGFSYGNYAEDKPYPICMSSEKAFYQHFFQTGLLYNGPTGTIFKRNEFIESGGFLDYGVASDYELNLRLAMIGHVVLFHRDLFFWRRHSGQAIALLNQDYQFQNRRILLDTLSKDKFPLNPHLKRKIRLNHNKNQARKIITRLIRLDLKTAKRIASIEQLAFVDYFHALLPAFVRNHFY